MLITLLISYLTLPIAWAENDDLHGDWNTLLQAHVTAVDDGKATVVNYRGMSQDHNNLSRYLRALSAVSPEQFDAWSREDQMAFLINAYNAWTVDLILTAWPNLKSIKDLGSLFRSPWSKKFIELLGETRSLDNIEHDLLRDAERYQDPRIHFAVNCASIGCPALRPEAYVGTKLDEQLNDQMRLFLSDRHRNRLEGNTLKLSAIFKWYREDFEKGWLGFHRLEDFVAANAVALGLDSASVTRINDGQIALTFLDYDWRLNQSP